MITKLLENSNESKFLDRKCTTAAQENDGILNAIKQRRFKTTKPIKQEFELNVNTQSEIDCMK